MFPSTMAPKRPILVSQCEMDHQKSTISLIFSTLSLGGCGGHPMRSKLNLKDKSQISTPDEYTDNFKSNLICIFPSVRAKLKKPLCPRTQCSKGYRRNKTLYHWVPFYTLVPFFKFSEHFHCFFSQSATVPGEETSS